MSTMQSGVKSAPDRVSVTVLFRLIGLGSIQSMCGSAARLTRLLADARLRAAVGFLADDRFRTRPVVFTPFCLARRDAVLALRFGRDVLRRLEPRNRFLRAMVAPFGEWVMKERSSIGGINTSQ